MTFGNDRWGSDDAEARRIFDRYVESGGNVLDCADVYAGGKSEEVLGRFVADAGLRDKLVIATKFTFNPQEGNPNSGGNGRKNIYRALEVVAAPPQDGLRRPLLDARVGHDHAGRRSRRYADHAGARGQDPLLRLLRCAGMVRGARADAGPVPRTEPVVALQLEYSLVERTIEREHIPAARELGMGICPWSPLASGFLAGKYTREKGAESSKGSRLEVLKKVRESRF